MASPRYNWLFEQRNAEGQFVDRVDLARALIDWADADEQAFAIDANAAGPEDYRYDQREDPYKAHNDYYDTVEETNLVRGMDPDYAEAFASNFTVYAGKQECKVNLASVKGDCTPLIVGLVRAALFPDPSKPDPDRDYHHQIATRSGGVRGRAARVPGGGHRRVRKGQEENHRHLGQRARAGQPRHQQRRVRAGRGRDSVLARRVGARQESYGSHYHRNRPGISVGQVRGS